MSSVLNSGSAVLTNTERNLTYDLNTQQGRSDFWDFIINVLGGTTGNPGLVAAGQWSSGDSVSIIIGDATYRITGFGQLWLHGLVHGNVPYSWSQMMLVVIDPQGNYVLMLRLFYDGGQEIYLASRSI